MSNGIKQKEAENKFFTIEFFGVTLIVTTFTLLVALVFGEDVLFELGSEIQYFLLGVFGYFSYPLLLSVNATGFMLLFGKKIENNGSKITIKRLVLFLVLVLLLLTSITGLQNPNDYSEYLSYAFNQGRLGFSNAVAGGWLFSLVTYPIVKYLSYVGAIILLSASLLVYIGVIIKIKVNESARKEETSAKTTEAQPTTTQTVQPQVIIVNPQQTSQYQQNGYQPQQYINQNVHPQQNNGYSPYSQGGYDTAVRERNMQILYGDRTSPYTDSYVDGYNQSFSRDRLNLSLSQNGYNNQAQNPSGYTNNGGVSNPIYKQREAPTFDQEDRTETSQIFDVPTYSYEEIEDEKTDIVDEFEDAESYVDNNYTQDTFDDQDDAEDIIQETQTQSNLKKEQEHTVKETEKDINTGNPVIQESTISENDGGDSDIYENIPKDYKYTPPPISLLENAVISDNNYQIEVFKAEVKNTILSTLKNFGIETTVARIFVGPAVTRFDIVVPDNVRVEDITKQQKNLNLRIAATSDIRMIERVPGTSYVGIEVPNNVVETVKIKDLVVSDDFCNASQNTLTFALGKDIIGKPISLDIAEMPHVLIAGTTGSGKSVCLNTMIISLLYKYSPLDLRFIIVDPKFVDFEPFHRIPHMLFNTIIEDVKTTSAMLTWAVEEMDRRYRVLSTARAKNLKQYNIQARQKGEKPIPRLVIIIDEFADIMKRDKKGVGDKVCLLAQKARAAGIHLILAAQRPSADIVEGPIKSNLPSRIVFRAASSVDSRVSLGDMGAEKLLGKGDCLYKTNTMATYDRVMGAFVSDEEMYSVIDYVTDHNKAYFDKNSWSKIMATCTTPEDTQQAYTQQAVESSDKIDDINIKALKLGIEYGGLLSISFLQRKLAVGFPRAGKIIDWLTEKGYISVDSVNNKRKVLITKEEFEEKFGSQNDET